MSETFTYDNLDRLTDISLNNVATGHMVYDALGRMTSKQADGQGVFSSAQYDYVGPDGQLRPHAVSGAVMAATPFPTDSLGLDYTMFDKVLEVGWSSNRRMRFDYGYDHQRIRVVTDRNMPPIHKTYIGNCERIDALSKLTAYRTYLSGPLGVFAVVSHTGGEVDSVTYVLKDHLGSWTVFADGDGDLVREESFDAWGNRRDAATWTGPATGGLLFQRGFTGHEHMEYTGLINMNGRLYDPVMSTFLSVDSYVQEPDFSQNFNRYAYCLNNPLRYTDPDGELVTELVVAMAISAAVNVVMSGINNTVYDRPFFEGAGKAAAIGALQGAFSYGIGAAAGLIGSAVKGVTNATWGMVAQAGFQVAAHGTLGGVSTWARGGSFWSGFASGAVASFVSTSTGIMTAELPKVWQVTCMVAAGGLSGGVTSTMAGGDFWDGVCNGLICAGLNHAMHLAADGGGKPFVRWLKDHANKYKHHYQTDIVNPEGRCKAAMAANIGHYYGSKRGGESFYWGRFESLYKIEHDVSLEKYFADCGFDFEIVGRNEIEKAVDLLPEGKLIVFQMEASGKFSSHVVALTGAVRESNDSDAMFRISNPMNRTENWEQYNNDFHNSIERIFIIRGLK